ARRGPFDRSRPRTRLDAGVHRRGAFVPDRCPSSHPERAERLLSRAPGRPKLLALDTALVTAPSGVGSSRRPSAPISPTSPRAPRFERSARAASSRPSTTGDPSNPGSSRPFRSPRNRTPAARAAASSQAPSPTMTASSAGTSSGGRQVPNTPQPLGEPLSVGKDAVSPRRILVKAREDLSANESDWVERALAADPSEEVRAPGSSRRGPGTGSLPADRRRLESVWSAGTSRALRDRGVR